MKTICLPTVPLLSLLSNQSKPMLTPNSQQKTLISKLTQVGRSLSTWIAKHSIFTGGTGIDTSGSGNAVTFAIDSTVATLTGTQTLTNKTLTTPVISTISNTGTLTLPTSTDTLVGRATTDTYQQDLDQSPPFLTVQLAARQLKTKTTCPRIARLIS